MSDEYTKTVRIPRPGKIHTDGRGRSVWTDPVETAEFELMSTTALKKVLDSDDDIAKKAIADAAASGGDGVLARDTATGLFEIVSDEDLQAILDDDFSLPKKTRPADVTLEPASDEPSEELSLVSTQALRKILHQDDDDQLDDLEPDGGFDPYNSG